MLKYAWALSDSSTPHTQPATATGLTASLADSSQPNSTTPSTTARIGLQITSKKRKNDQQAEFL